MTVEFTGERFVPSISGEIRHEHLHRYAFSLAFVRGKNVLDVACGEGYGSAMLAAHARHVVGADIVDAVVEEARTTYAGRPNLEFVHGDVAALPFADRSFDVVVSFETIEHHARHDEMLSECARVLRPDGLLILSSPNKKVYSDDAGYHNEFHVKELYFDDLDALLKRHFRHVKYLGQRLATGSAIYALAPTKKGAARVWNDDGTTPRAGMPLLPAPMYFLALATQKKAPDLGAGSVLISQADDLYGEFKTVAKWASGVHNELTAAQAGAREALSAAERQGAERLEAARAEALRTIEDLNGQLQRTVDDRASATDQLLQVKAHLSGVESEFASARDALRVAKLDAQQEAAKLHIRHAEQLGALAAEWAAAQVADRASQSQRERQITADHTKLQEETRRQREEYERLAVERERTIALERDTARAAVEREQTALAAGILQTQDLKQQLIDERVRNAQERDTARAALEREQTALAASILQTQDLKQQLIDERARYAQERDTVRAAREREQSAVAATILQTQDLRQQLIDEGVRYAQERDTARAALECEQSALAATFLQTQDLKQQLIDERVRYAQERDALRVAMGREQTALAATVLQTQDLKQQLIESQSQAALRIEVLQREFVDLERRSRASEAAASIRMANLNLAVQGQRFQLQYLRRQIQIAMDSLWWRLAGPIRRLAGGSASAGALSGAIAETQAMDLSNPRDLARFSSSHSGNLESSSIGLAHRSSKPSPVSVSDLLALDGTRFVQQAYLAVLGREPDPDGLRHYCELLGKGSEKVEVLSHLRYSEEGMRRRLVVAGLEQALKDLQLSRMPLMGFMFKARLRAAAAQSDSGASPFALEGGQGAELLCLAHALSSSRDLFEFDVFGTARTLLQSTPNEFLTLLYRVTLSREPQPHERSHYTGLLEAGSSRQHVTEIVLRSDEFRGRAQYAQSTATSSHGTGQVLIARDQDAFLGASAGAAPAEVVALPLPVLPRSAKPLVSVIVPVYGKLEFTLQCLRSIAAQPPKVAFEVIVVDDCSPDDSATVLSSVQGLCLVSNARNIGFIGSCNHGAREATGEYLCFLNNDTEVHPGWLDELVRTFAIFPHTGFAGSKLIYPDGTLQEAGGILWQDGSAWNFGRGQSPDLPVFNYAREVDYCSGASIMVPASLFTELGGFDEHYMPAYCEDSDLALKIRSRGYRVIYQPMSVVVHHEGITSGTDTGHGTKAYQVTNGAKLFERWKHRLATHQPNGVNPDNAKDRRMKHRVLVLEHCTPTPDQDAGSVSVFNMLLLLREMDFQVTFIAEDNFLYMPDYTVMLQRAGIEVLYAPYVRSVAQHLQEAGGRYDLVYLFRPVVVERHIDTVRSLCPQAKVLFYTHDIHHIRMEREAELTANAEKALEAGEMKAREFKAMKAVDATIVVSTAEMDILQPQLPGQPLQILPLLLDIPGTERPWEARQGIVFVGGYQHVPNVDAVQYFVNEVMPLLRQRLPGVRFHAVGSKPPEAIIALAAPDVVIEGFVEDLKPLLDSMRLSVAPLRYGAGVKGKVGTALANGLPTVVTPIAAEGMSIVDGEQVLIAETPQEIVDAVDRLYGDSTLWAHLSKQGIEFADRAWGPTAAFQTFGGIVISLGFSVPSPPFPLSMYSANVFNQQFVAEVG
jgi:GT2 family glycosyltransferase/ubiquinone/menaquinone biosynthesis C-methylase UbiE/glycosyltransferase involved in cell wall biosynthesis